MKQSSVYRRRSGFTLIEILVVMVIIIILSSVMYGVYLGKGGKGAPPGKAHSPMERAKDVVCMENIRSVRQSIVASHVTDTEEKYPASLLELKELPSEFRSCPEGKEPYQYSPSNGEVHCVHPGHEKY